MWTVRAPERQQALRTKRGDTLCVPLDELLEALEVLARVLLEDVVVAGVPQDVGLVAQVRGPLGQQVARVRHVDHLVGVAVHDVHRRADVRDAPHVGELQGGRKEAEGADSGNRRGERGEVSVKCIAHEPQNLTKSE
eukprot:4157986-Pyramimonas_sp.AAC.1